MAQAPGTDPTPVSANSTRPVYAVVLAAGLGKRMRSQKPKVLHELCGRAMVDHVLSALEAAGVSKIFVVVGHQGEEVREHIKGRAVCIDQTERLGTGHAVLQAAPMLASEHGDVIVTCGDAPLLTPETYRLLIDHRRTHHSAGIVLTAAVPDPKGYGRVVRRDKESVQKIVEEKDASDIQRKINEVNTGTYCFDIPKLFTALRLVTNNNQQGEYYLTDVIEILIHSGHEFEAVMMADWTEMLGINSREQLAEASATLQKRVIRRVLEEGVTIVDPNSTHIDINVKIGADTVIEPFTVLRGDTVIGSNCKIGPLTSLFDAKIGDGATVRQAVVEKSDVPPGEIVWPFTHVANGANPHK